MRQSKIGAGRRGLPTAERFKLHFGPYRAPKFKLGTVVRDAARGEVEIIGLTDAKIPWPIGKRRHSKAPILYAGLVRAVLKESGVAIYHWWGVSRNRAYGWRRVLGAKQVNEGAYRLKARYGKSPANLRQLRRATVLGNTPEARAKVAAALTGRKRPEEASRKIISAQTGRPKSAETRRKISQTFKRLGIVPPKSIGHLWSSREDRLLRTLPPAEAARKTGRTPKAVYHRRQKLKLTKPRLSRRRHVMVQTPPSRRTARRSETG